MFVDYVQNGEGFGEVGEVMSDVRFDPGLLRPYWDDRNKYKLATINTGRKAIDKKTGSLRPVYEEARVNDLIANGIMSPVFNATTLRKEEWIRMDQRLHEVQRPRLRAWGDLSAASTYGGFDGMSATVLEHETVSDPGEAVVDMDGLAEGRNDLVRYQLEGLPLPITHADFWLSARKLAISRKSGTPLDSRLGASAMRRVAEMIEKTTIGTVTGVTYGGGSATPTYGRASKVFGYTNFTDRNTLTTLTAPTAVGWTAATTVADVLAMRDLLFADNFFGPFMLYHSTDWDKYLDNDYSIAGGNNPNQTLRQRLRATEGIQDVRRLDYLTSSTNPFTLLMISMTEDTARAVNGMESKIVQWEAKGGMQLMFKVMCINVPQLFADFDGRCGIVHATTS